MNRRHQRRQVATTQRSFRGHLESLESRRMLTGNAWINEIYFDPPGGSDAVFEYIELRGTPGMSLANTYFIFIENENSAAAGHVGDIDNIFDLSNRWIGSDGFLTLRQNNFTTNQYTVSPGTTDLVNAGGSGWGSTGTSTVRASDESDEGEIENGGFTAMLVNTGGMNAPTIGFDLDAGNNGLDLPNGRTGWAILDSIGIHAEAGEAAGGRLYAPINFGVGATSRLEPGAVYVNVPFEIEYIARWGNSTGSAPADWLVSNLTDNGLSGYTGHGDFRQSGSPHGVGAPNQVVEANQAVPYGTNRTGTLGAPNFPGVAPSSTVSGRQLFYNNSFFDDAASDPSFNNDTAIATDKVALLPGGGTATFANYSTFDQGINGIMVDLTAGGAHGSIVAGDFSFKTSGAGGNGASNDPSTWSPLNIAPSVNVRTGAGLGGADRVELTWPAGTILDTWLQVTVAANGHTGLASDDHFYFGNMPGDTNNDADATFKFVDSLDESLLRENSNLAGSDLFFSFGLVAAVQNTFDVNRDDQIDSLDQSVARQGSQFPFNELDMINIALAGPFAPMPADAILDHAAAALASALSRSTDRLPPMGTQSLANELASSSATANPTFPYFRQLAADESLEVTHTSLAERPTELDDQLLELLSARWHE